MTARFPLTLYSPSMSRPAAQTHTAPSQQHTQQQQHTHTTAAGSATSPLHRLHTLLHKTWDCRPLLCTQLPQVAAKDVVCRGEEKMRSRQQTANGNAAGGRRRGLREGGDSDLGCILSP